MVGVVGMVGMMGVVGMGVMVFFGYCGHGAYGLTKRCASELLINRYFINFVSKCVSYAISVNPFSAQR